MPAPMPATARPLRVGVTLHPYYSWASNVAAGIPEVEVRAILPGEIDAGNYQPRPEDIQKLVDLDAVVVNAAGHDDFINPMIRASGNARLVTVEAGEDVLLLRAAQPGSLNSHTFLGFGNAVLGTFAIERALSALRPDLAPRFADNARRYAARLRAMRARAQERAGAAKIHRVVTVHDGYAYLCQELGVEIAGVVEPAHGLVPSAAELGAMIDLLRREKITVVLTEETFPAPLLGVLRDAARVDVRVISHVASGAYTPEKFEVEMAANVDALIAALGGPP
jgi:zinc transport system substrate-binding protein